jgi:catechol 2,3-dioxygenase-like lactoylglutathione lyase family enzyme
MSDPVSAIGRLKLLFHTMIGSNDIERSKRFYNAVLGTLGVGEASLNMAGSGHTRLFYAAQGGTHFIVTQPINDEPANVANGSTVAFSCNSPEQVKQFHDTAVANGGTSIEDQPGPRVSAMGNIHLAYVRDPDGNKLCGIHIPAQ